MNLTDLLGTCLFGTLCHLLGLDPDAVIDLFTEE